LCSGKFFVSIDVLANGKIGETFFFAPTDSNMIPYINAINNKLLAEFAAAPTPTAKAQVLAEYEIQWGIEPYTPRIALGGFFYDIKSFTPTIDVDPEGNYDYKVTYTIGSAKLVAYVDIAGIELGGYAAWE
jgi:hypothetical protein